MLPPADVATTVMPADTAAAVDLDRFATDTIRVLAMDAVQAANSGHPGMPMAMAPVAHVLFTRHLRHDPADPDWPDRDRFILSAGHGSMLLYASLFLTGYDLGIDDLKAFRQWGSRTPGHPERILGHTLTPGVETTTGPLGQGFANGVGMAMAERFLRERFGAEACDHRIYAICSDGDLMEGVAGEAASLAGHLGLGRLVYLWDDNEITIDGGTGLSFKGEDVAARFEAYGWQVLGVDDANDQAALDAAITAAKADEGRPSLIRVKSVIAWPSPAKQGTSASHGAPLGEDEVRATKQILGFDPDQSFVVPDGVAEHCDQRERGGRARRAWQERFDAWREANPALAAEWEAAWAGRAIDGLAGALPRYDPAERAKVSTRVASGEVMNAIASYMPTQVGGSADLAGSVMTTLKGETDFGHGRTGRNVHWGVREHAMASAVNGMVLHGGIVRPFGSTFLIFSDYMRPAVRLSALMRLPVVWIFSHDSLGLGEDGPTHQPIEHLASLRAIPGLTVIRPSDAAEVAEAWRVIVEELEGPAALVLSRQNLPVLDRGVLGPAEGVGRGAYVLLEDDDAEVTLVATGSEVVDALTARDLLAERDITARVVAMPSWELFADQDLDYIEDVIPPELPSVSLEAGSTFGWERWVDLAVGVDRFGASAPGPELLDRLGISAAEMAAAAEELIAEEG